MQAPVRNGLIEEWDPERAPAPLPSPCINVCDMNPQTGFCRGCLRTIDEIAGWSSAGEARKRGIWLAIRQRYEALK